MKDNPLGSLLVGLVCISVVATAFMAFTYVRTMRKVQQLQVHSAVINRNRALIQSMANDAVEYSRRNPAIDPILQAVGLKPRTNTNPPPAGTKPPAR